MNVLWTLLSVLTASRVRTRGPAPCVYLTFDDGPHATLTAKLLDLLAQHEVKATFFLLGCELQKTPELAHRMVAEGHALGNHSMTHARFRSLGLRAQWQEIEQADQALQPMDGRTRHLFRPPNGRFNLATLLCCLCRSQPLMLWSHDSHDFKLDSAALIQRLSSFSLCAGDVVLFHDDTGSAIAALAVLLPQWKQAGLRFGVLS